eukprot:573719-Pyramimonas_sp.AAC.1
MTMYSTPWANNNRPQQTQEQLLHSAGQALAGSLAMRGTSSPASGQLANAPPTPFGHPPPTQPAFPGPPPWTPTPGHPDQHGGRTNNAAAPYATGLPAPASPGAPAIEGLD